MRYMLDTNIVSDLIKNPCAKAASRIRTFAPHEIVTSIIVAGELQYGGSKKNSATLQRRIDEILNVLTVLPLESACAQKYGAIRAALENKGTPIGANDLWIAAHALVLDITLVTHNVQEFVCIDGLKTENWLD